MPSLPGIIILILACIGNAEWWIILVNRRHSVKARHQHLLKIRLLHDIGILGFPPFILYVAGRGPNGLLNGGSVFDLSLPVQGILTISIIGVFPLLWSLVRWQLTRRSLHESTVDAELIDTLEGASPQEADAIRGDSRSLLLRFPGNEIFRMEVNRKRIVIRGDHGPGSRDSTDTVGASVLRIAHFSDIHLIGCPGDAYHDLVVEKLLQLEPDLFVFTGDLLDKEELIPRASELFRRLVAGAPGYFVLGNHDWCLRHEEIRAAITETGWTGLAGESATVSAAGLSILVAGSELPWMGSDPVVPQRESEDLRLLLSHTPDLRNFADQEDFDVMLCGHNHGGQVVLPLVGPVYSPSIYGVKYAGGVYRYRDLVMHVSRGVGAKDLLRWNCPPEISLLEFQIPGNNS